MAKSIPPSSQSIPDFWANVRAEALQEWNGDSSRTPWDSVKERRRVTATSLLATIGGREQTAGSELKRIQTNVAPELKRLERQVNSRLKRVQRQVRAALKRMGDLPLAEATKEVLNTEEPAARKDRATALKQKIRDLSNAVLALGPNEHKLRAILDVQPFHFLDTKPSSFPKHDRIAVVLGVSAPAAGMRRPVTLRDLALASLLLGNKPELDPEERGGWGVSQAIAAEQDNMRKAAKRAEKFGFKGIDEGTADFLLQGRFLQGTPRRRQN